jgi:hypothetical protein
MKPQKQTIPFTNDKPESKGQDWKLEDKALKGKERRELIGYILYKEEDVKDFIRKLKQRVENSIYPDNFDINDLFEIIDELAGKSLVEKK